MEWVGTWPYPQMIWLVSLERKRQSSLFVSSKSDEEKGFMTLKLGANVLNIFLRH
jgi:hypothetical protein